MTSWRGPDAETDSTRLSSLLGRRSRRRSVPSLFPFLSCPYPEHSPLRSTASGSGKSTITALLLRQYDLPNPTSLTSNIFIQSRPINTLNTSFLRSQLAIVSQDPQLLAGSILENVSIGLTGTPNELKLDRSNLDVVEQLCRVALEQAQAWAFVQKLPKGIYTSVSGGKTGVLSGGQKQRSEFGRVKF